jgi:PKD repeat protein
MKIHRLLTALFLVLLVGGCDQVDFTAPTGSTLSITAQPPTVAVNGTSNITVTGTRSNGAPLPDGTVITFTTNLGTVDPNPAETKDGMVFARFRAGTRSGTASIIARSGDTATEPVEVIIGEARAARLVLVATPITLPIGGGRVQLRAHVSDEEGNALAGIGVIFRTTSGELNSRGRIVRTNDSGVAFDTLTTNIDAEVTATTSNGGGEDTATVDVAPGEGPDECNFSVSPSEPTVGEAVFFADTSTPGDGPALVEFLWDFGDGETAEGLTVTHEYGDEGTFTVVHTVVDADGFSTICTQDVTVIRGEPNCTFDFNPTDPVENEPVFFDASDSFDPDGIILTYTWQFNDGTATVTESDPTISHTFADSGNYTVVLTVEDDDGNTSVCTQSLFVDVP